MPQEIRLNEDFIRYCNNKLTPHEFVVFLACRIIGVGRCTQAEIAAIAGVGESIRKHLKAIQHKGFIKYDGTSGIGTILVWIRLGEFEKPPAWIGKSGLTHIKLVSPDQQVVSIKRGKFREFCRKQNLNRRALYDLLSGDRKQYKGWRLG